MTLMPFGDTFRWNDISTYTWEEYSILGAALFLLLVLLIFIPFSISKRNKKKMNTKINQPTVVVAHTVKTNNKTVITLSSNDFTDGKGNSLLFQNDNAWIIQSDGKTELYKAVLGSNVKLLGKVVFATPAVKKTLVTQEGDHFIKTAAIECNYITLDFISENEVKFGNVLYANQIELVRRANNLKLLQEQEAKDLKAKLAMDKKIEAKEIKKNKKR